jgi:hypothetical protein
MSTKVTIRWSEAKPGQPAFHLYEDCLDGPGDNGEPPVYLELKGVAVGLETLSTSGAAITLAIPRALARELGLLPAEPRHGAPSGDEFQR